MTVQKRSRGFRALALLLAVLTLFFLLSPHNGYHDPAGRWLPSNNRTNELDANTVVTHETFLCYSCDRYTGFTV